MDDRRYFQLIHDFVRTIPSGEVMSYGQVAAAVGCSARVAGWALANVTDDNVPWQRVVGADGYLRIGKRSAVLQDVQRKLLEREGVTFKEDGCVDMERHQVGRGPVRTLELALE
jgi:methylated-DNA-protein-cysteine methyltransferase-like protein